MNVIVNGAGGHMGSVILSLTQSGYRGASLAAAVDVSYKTDISEKKYSSLAEFSGDCDCIIDFSHHLATRDLLDYSSSRKLPVVIATTGQDKYELDMIHNAAKTNAVFHSANMSLGIALLCELAKKAASVLPDADIEIVEAHHNRKLDAPSGTALMIADEIKSVRNNAQYIYGRQGQSKREKNEIGIHALRLGNIVGDHEVILSTETQTIRLKHEAQTRSLFAEGAVAAAGFMVGRKPGLYTMKDLITL